jgi:hypothetical protein
VHIGPVALMHSSPQMLYATLLLLLNARRAGPRRGLFRGDFYS